MSGTGAQLRTILEQKNEDALVVKMDDISLEARSHNWCKKEFPIQVQEVGQWSLISSPRTLNARARELEL